MRLLALLTAIAALCAAASPSRAAYPGRPGAIAYVAGPIVVQILTPGGRTIVVAWSSTAPSWSPDGRFLAFSENATGHPSIAVARSTGAPYRRLTSKQRHFADYNPTWSPDGKRIAFEREIVRASDQSGYATDWISDIFVVDARGGHLRRLTRDGAKNTDPSWSPEGHTIAFTRSGNLVALDVRTGIERPLVQDADAAAWSPDGRRLAFTRLVDPSTQAHAAFIVSARGGLPRRISPASLDVNSGVAWSPDGRQLALSAPTPEGLSGIYVVSADGRGRPRLRTRGSWPDWQPLPTHPS